VKYTILFNERQDQRLTELAAKLGVSKADVVRRAVHLLTVIVRETAGGERPLQVVDETGKVKQIIAPS
jgi:Ribbon-helix-helix domain